jgi:hypothetical protein
MKVSENYLSIIRAVAKLGNSSKLCNQADSVLWHAMQGGEVPAHSMRAFWELLAEESDKRAEWAKQDEVELFSAYYDSNMNICASYQDAQGRQLQAWYKMQPDGTYARPVPADVLAMANDTSIEVVYE